MTQKIVTIAILYCFFLVSCTPIAQTTLIKIYPTLDYRQTVTVLKISDTIPSNGVIIGNVTINSGGPLAENNLEYSVREAVYEARKIGGNAIKITTQKYTTHYNYSYMSITASILKINEPYQKLDKIVGAVPISEQEQINHSIKDTAIINETENIKNPNNVNNIPYAQIHIYGNTNDGMLFGHYKILVNDSIAGIISDKFKKTIYIFNEDNHVFIDYKKTKQKLPDKIRLGNTYYYCLTIKPNGDPSLIKVDNSKGKSEIKEIRDNKENLNDMLLLNDGRKIACKITNENNKTVFILIKRNKELINTVINKENIKQIIRCTY